MAAEDPALVLGEATRERGYPFERTPPLPERVYRGLIGFARRKPLGAFGALLVFVPIMMSLLLPGLDLGIVKLPRIVPYAYDDYELGRHQLEGPSLSHPMGTDQLGRDLFARLLYGARLSYLIGFGIIFIQSIISTSLSVVSAYYIRTVDLFLQRVIEIAGFVPSLILLVALFSIYGATPLALILTLGVVNGIHSGRILRSVVIGVRAMPYIESARMLGASDMRIILRHILPQVGYIIIISATGGLASAILAESGLAILGFGVSPNFPTFGNLLNASRQYLRVAPYLALFPGLVLFMVLLGARLFGDALRDVLDPRLRGSS
jgi:peptide/nickel transport system permease protein